MEPSFTMLFGLCLLLGKGVSQTCKYDGTSAELEEIELIHYAKSIYNHTSVKVGDVLDLYDKLDDGKPIDIFVFGFRGTPDLPSTQAMTKAYVAREDVNYVLLNWQNISNCQYIYAASKVASVGYTLATVLNRLVKRGLNASSIHLVGHSLGAQICGYASRMANFRITRIVGLDPAGPAFYMVLQHLTYADANFVLIIHTDMYALGNALQAGHVDFYPNGGITVQPGCTRVILLSDICSHFRAIYYYAASLLNESMLMGEKCNSKIDFALGRCGSNEKAVMGYGTPATTRGKYHSTIAAEDFEGQDGETSGQAGTVWNLIPQILALLT